MRIKENQGESRRIDENRRELMRIDKNRCTKPDFDNHRRESFLTLVTQPGTHQLLK